MQSNACPNYYKYLVLLFSCLIVFAFEASQMCLAPLLNDIIHAINIGTAKAGFLIGSSTACGIVFAYFISKLANQYSRKILTIIALCIMAVGVGLISIAPNYWLMLTGRLLGGIGSTTLMIISPLFITDTFDLKTMGRAMSIFTAAQPLGIILTLNILGILNHFLAWRSILLYVVGFIVVIAAIVTIGLKNPQEAETDETEVLQHGGEFGFNVWILAIVYMLFTLTVAAYINFGPHFFTELHSPHLHIGILVSSIMVIPLLVAPAIGLLLDTKLHKRKKLCLILSALIMGIGFIGTASLHEYANTAWLWAILLGIGFASVGPICYALIPEILDKKKLHLGTGVLVIAFDVGGALGPMLFGVVVQLAHNSFSAGFLTLAFILLLTTFGVGYGLKR